jgi:hypothetical protein
VRAAIAKAPAERCGVRHRGLSDGYRQILICREMRLENRNKTERGAGQGVHLILLQ